MSSTSEQWKAYRDKIPGMDEFQQPPLTASDDSDSEFQAMLDQLPVDIAERVSSAHAESEEIEWGKLIEPQWCLCETPEGEFPRVYALPSLERLVELIAKREGEETAVWPMWGIPLRLTKAKTIEQGNKQITVRYLLLPNQKAAVISAEKGFQLVDQSLLPVSLELEEEGWLGDQAYLESQSFYVDGYIDDDSFTGEDDDPDDDDDPDADGGVEED